MCGHVALVDVRILLLVDAVVKRHLFSSFEFKVLDGFFEIGHFELPAFTHLRT